MGVCKLWTGLLDWNTGLDYWTEGAGSFYRLRMRRTKARGFIAAFTVTPLVTKHQGTFLPAFHRRLKTAGDRAGALDLSGISRLSQLNSL